MKKILHHLSILLLILMISTFAIFGNVNYNKINAAEPGHNYTVGIRGYNDEWVSTEFGAVAYPRQNSTVAFEIYLDIAASEAVYVYYRTKDFTAVAESEDYVPVDDYIIFNPGEQKRTITVGVASTTFAIQFGDGKKAVLSRFFAVELYNTSENATIDNANKQMYGNVAYSHTYSTKITQDNYTSATLTSDLISKTILEYSDSNYEYSKELPATENVRGGTRYVYWSFLDSTKTELMDYYLEPELTHLYISAKCYPYGIDATQWNSECSIGAEKCGDSVWVELDGPFIYGEHLDFRALYDDMTFDNDEFVDDKTDEDKITKLHLGSGALNEFYRTMAKGTDNRLYLKYDSHGAGFTKTRCCKDITMYVRSVDDMGPDIIGWYIDKSLNIGETTAYLKVRFSEPIKFKSGKSAPSIYCNVNNHSKIGATFTYFTGEGTDTLVFKLDIKDEIDNQGNTGLNTVITSFSPKYISNWDTIVDMSSQENTMAKYAGFSTPESEFPSEYHPYDCGSDLSTKIDARTPELGTPDEAKQIKASHHITFDCSEFDEKTGTIYYSWSTDVSVEPNRIVRRETDYVSKASYTGKKFVIDGQDMSGMRYLFIKAVSTMGNVDEIVCGPYLFDNNPEIVTNVTYGESALLPTREKQISFDLNRANSYFYESDITYADIIYSTEERWREETEYYYNNKLGNQHYYDASNLFTTYVKITTDTVQDKKLVFNTMNLKKANRNDVEFDAINNTTEKTTYITNYHYECEVSYLALGMDEGEFFKGYFGFNVTDVCGNTREPGAYGYSTDFAYFETRSVIVGNYAFNGRRYFNDNKVNIYSTKDGSFTFTPTDTSLVLNDVDCSIIYNISRPERNGVDAEGKALPELTQEDCNRLFTFSYANNVLTVTPNSDQPDIAGYYTFYFTMLDKDTDDPEDKISTDVSFYLISDNFTDPTYNVLEMNKATFLINKVFQISNEVGRFYYRDASNKMYYEAYSKGDSLSFSTPEKAREYLTYLEYQDLYLVCLTEEQANRLKQNNSGYYKAEGETNIPQAGDYWIRYKKKTFSTNDISDNSWVYYYTSLKSNKIDLEHLPRNLSDAINSYVGRMIDDYGSYLYLTSQSGLDKYGSPYLNPSAIKGETLTCDASLSGTAYQTNNKYVGDSAIFSSYVYDDSYKNEFILASTYTFTYSDQTIIYMIPYEYINSASEFGYEKIDKFSATTIKQLVKDQNRSSGIYRLYEIDAYGCHMIDVYIDVTAPRLTYSYTILENNKPKEIQAYADSEQEVSGISFSLDSIINEVDDYAYVAIFENNTDKLVRAFTKGENEMNGYTLENGVYRLEVYDRSGNFYKIILKLNATTLKVEITEQKNVSITVLVKNRETSDIFSYEIWRNNKLLTSEFTDKAIFKDDGTYRIYIRDWYGGVFDDTYEFIRQTPDIEWSYWAGTSYSKYNVDDSIGMFVNKESPQSIKISYNTNLKATYVAALEVSYEVIKGSPTIKQNSVKSGSASFEIESQSEFVLKIFYDKYPDIYSLYYFNYDKTAPTIRASYEQSNYIDAESQELEEALKQINVKEGDLLTPSHVSFIKHSTYNRTIPLNSEITTNRVDVQFEDISGIKSFIVTIDDEVVLNSEDLKEFLDLYQFTKYGKYQIKCVDKLGNTSVLNFRNLGTSDVTYNVDGTSYDVPVSSADHFNPDGNCKVYPYGDTEIKLLYDYDYFQYGNQYMEFSFKDNQTLSMIVFDGVNRNSIMFSYSENSLKRLYYVATKTYDSPQEHEGEIISPYSLVLDEAYGEELLSYAQFMNKTLAPNEYVQIATYDADGCDMYAYYTTEGRLMIRVVSSNYEDIIYEIDAKIMSDDLTEPIYLKSYLSKTKTDIILINSKGEVETNQNGDIIYANGNITVDSEKTDVSLLQSVKIAYSEIDSYDSYTEIFRNNILGSFKLNQNGFYHIVILNKFGNYNYYKIAISDECMIITEIVYSNDENKTTYSSKYKEKVIYSNYIVNINIYSDFYTCTFRKDGLLFTPTITRLADHDLISLNEQGNYSVLIVDKFGNEYSKIIDIESKELSRSEAHSLFTGFNEAALRKDEGYTNQVISIDIEQLVETSFVYIYVYQNGELVNILYDLISEKKVELDEANLLDCIGVHGDGVYDIVLKDCYGNKITETIHYLNTCPIKVERQTRNDVMPVEYNVVLEEEDIYSNNLVFINSVAKVYNITVDGSRVELPLKLEFKDQSKENVRLTKKIIYLDEYGFSYAFDVNLIRQNISFDQINVDEIQYEDLIYTRKDFSLSYSEGLTCTYKLNDDVAKTYISDETLRKEGKYTFTLTDKSGNIAYYIVTKDSICDYYFTNHDVKIISETVVNSGSVVFNTHNYDTVYIYNVFKDGKYIPNYDSNSFQETGKWEVIIKDLIGNTSKFNFYIINHEINYLDYTCPENYIITDIRYVGPNGVEVSVPTLIRDDVEFIATDDGNYHVMLYSTVTRESLGFEFTISTAKPQAKLKGCKEGERTINNIVLTDTSSGDIIYVYLDGKLVETFEVINDNDSPVIDTKGNYRLVVQNIAGNTSEYTFTRNFVANTATSVLLIIVVCALTIFLFIAMVLRNKTKVDK